MAAAILKEIDMEVVIDGQSKSIDVTGIGTLNELLARIERDCIGGGRVIVRVLLNEEELDEGQTVGLGAFPVKDITSISVETADTLELAGEALQDALEYLPAISMILEQSARKIREGDVRAGLQETSEALGVIEAFGEVLDGIRGAFRIDFSKVKIDDGTLLEKLHELGKHAQNILKATKEEDWTLLADLIEYELSPLLYEWMAVVPELVSMLPGSRESSGGESS
jgi:hypothetical protein